MVAKRQNVATVCAALLVAGLVTAPASPAQAVWTYEDANGNQCNPDAGSDTVTLDPPQGLLMLDRSLSMSFGVDSNSSNPSRWEVAVDAINALTADVAASDPDTLRFGLGLWTTSGTSNTSLDIDIPVQAADDTHTAIENVLANTGPSGLTPMADAITAMAISDTVSNAPSASFGVLVTDGVPQMDVSNDSDPVLYNAAVEAACTHRATAPMYTIGLGGGTNVNFNHVLAAAGGTGSCPSGDPCAAGTGHQYDAFYWAGDGCSGAFQADDQQGLINALSSISNQLSCTYSLDALTASSTQPWDDTGQGCAADDYECIDITLSGTSRIHHIDSGQTHVGWRFADASHQTVKILNTADGADQDYCDQIQSGIVDNPNGNDVSIKLACMCVQPVGGSCSDADFCYNDPAGSNCGNRPGTCECPVGTWSCTQGLDYCEQDVPCGQTLVDDGATDCDAGIGACMETGPVVCTGGPNGDGQGGTLECSVDGDPSAATEETCNGIDDDCDGAIDELGDDTGRCHVDFGDDADEIAKETNRCKIGYAFCGTGGTIGCQALEPMPEICNGIDDDCDGEVDNLSNSWADFTDTTGNAMYSLPAEAEGAACYERDVCQCMDGHDAIEGAGFDAYVDSWTNDSDPADPTCTCGEGLAR